MAYEISSVSMQDAKVLACIQTESWKAGFSGILDQAVLERMTNLEKVQAMYERTISNGGEHGYLLRVDGQPHCIAWWGAARDADMQGYAELICIHSLPGRWRMGYGSRMMEKVLWDIKADGFNRVMLWVFEENIRARSFYERHGFCANGKTKRGFGAVEMCYEKAL